MTDADVNGNARRAPASDRVTEFQNGLVKGEMVGATGIHPTISPPVT